MMKRLERRIKGWRRVEICGAFPESVLNACAMQALELWELECAGDYALRFSVYEGSMAELEEIVKKCMCELRVIDSAGGSRNRLFIKNHMWLFISAVLILALLCLSTLFIWNIDVYGC